MQVNDLVVGGRYGYVVPTMLSWHTTWCFTFFLDPFFSRPRPAGLSESWFWSPSITSGQIIATSAEVTPKGSVLEGKWDPLFQGNLGW